MLFRLHFCKQFLFCFLNGSSPLKNRFLCCNSSIFAPKVLLQRIEVSLVAWSLHWLFAIFTNVNCLCGNFENDYVKSLKVLVWASWFGTVNWTIYFSSTSFVDMSMFVGVFLHLTILISEVVVVVRLLLTDCSWSLTLFVPYLLASSLVLSALSACQSSVDFKNCFGGSKIVVKLLNFWRPVVAKLLWWHLLLWKLESVEGCDLGFLVVGENWQYNNCKIVEN